MILHTRYMQFVIHTKYIVEKHTVSSEQLKAHGYLLYPVYISWSLLCLLCLLSCLSYNDHQINLN